MCWCALVPTPSCLSATFRNHDVTTLRARHWVGERYQELSRWWREGGGCRTFGIHTLPAADWMGIALLDDHGHALLNQFVVWRAR